MSEDARFGFEWGPMKVTRMAHTHRRGYVLRVETDHEAVEVFVTEKGRKISVYPQTEGVEWDGPPREVGE